MANTATLFPSWKLEVNRRVADHLSHKAPSADDAVTEQESRPAPAGRAAEAAARVAARYAHAPSFSEMLAEEARAAVRAAEAASKAAQEAHAAAQNVLAGLEAASSPEPSWEQGTAPNGDSEHKTIHTGKPSPGHAPATLRFRKDDLIGDLFEPKPHFETSEPSPLDVNGGELRPADGEASVVEWREQAALGTVTEIADYLDAAGTAQPIPANLIQFPREMVATRKLRPRRVEGPLAATERDEQLSIFEVDPESISTQPAAAVEEPAAPSWMRTKLSSAEMKPQPQGDLLEEPAAQARPTAPVDLAPLSQRLLAFVMDLNLMVAAFLAAAILVMLNAKGVPGPRAAALGAAFALLVAGAIYQSVFLVLAKSTPGMRYAGIALSTFDGYMPNRAERRGRLLALILSVMPLGLGLVWALFDDGQLAWHDRLSRTYLRKRREITRPAPAVH